MSEEEKKAELSVTVKEDDPYILEKQLKDLDALQKIHKGIREELDISRDEVHEWLVHPKGTPPAFLIDPKTIFSRALKKLYDCGDIDGVIDLIQQAGMDEPLQVKAMWGESPLEFRRKISAAIKTWREAPTTLLEDPQYQKQVSVEHELRQVLLAMLRGDVSAAMRSMVYLLKNYNEPVLRGAIFNAFPEPNWDKTEKTDIPAASQEEDVVPLNKLGEEEPK